MPSLVQSRISTRGARNGAHSDFFSNPLGARRREITILRTTALWGCEYEWSVHVSVFAAHVGLTDEQVAATLPGRESASLWEADEAIVFDAATELTRGGRLAAETNRKVALLPVAERLELVALCGAYATVSYLANHCELELEPGAPSWSHFLRE